MQSKEKKGNVNRKLIFASLRRNPKRTAGIFVLTAATAFSVVFAWILARGTAGGIHQINERFGADILVTSEAGDLTAADYFLNVLESHEYVDASYVDDIARLPGVRRASGQFFLTSLGTGCCETKVNIVGIDQNNDFTIQPWISENYGETPTDGSVLIGYHVNPKEEGHIKVFDKEYPVAGKLEETGTSLDNSMFADMTTVRDIMEQAKNKGYAFPQKYEQEGILSAIYVDAEDGADLEELTDEINRIDGIKAVKMQTMVESISGAVAQLEKSWNTVLVLLIVFALVIVFILYGISDRDRKKELAQLRLLGMERAQVKRLVLGENLLPAFTGSLIGILVGSVIILAFHTFLFETREIPFLLPGLLNWLAGIVLAVLIAVLPGSVLLSRRIGE